MRRNLPEKPRLGAAWVRRFFLVALLAALSLASGRMALAAPPTPTITSATVGDTAVSLSWTASAGAASYNIYRSTTTGTETLLAPSPGIGTTYTDNTAANGIPYFYTVTAVDAASAESAQSNEVTATATAPIPPPNTPPGLTATAGDGQVALAWDIPTSGGTPDGYYVYRKLTSGFPYGSPYATVTGAASTTYTDPAATNGTTYYYVIAAFNLAGASVITSEVSATPALTAPGAPILSASAGDTQVTLTLAPGTGGAPATYTISRSATPGGPYTTTVASNIAGPTFTDTGLTNGATYYYVATATNAVSTSGDSPEASATPQATAPAAPTGLSAAAGNAQVTLNWTTSAGATSYNIYRSTSTGTETLLAPSPGVGTTYTDTGLINGITYFYKVTAVNAGGESAKSNEDSATPVAPLVVPDAPTGLTATGGNNLVTLNWTAPTTGGAPASYNVYRSTSTGTETLLPTVLITGTTYTDNTAVNGTTYFYKVTAVNATGEGALSNEASATPVAPLALPDVPTALTATPGNNLVTLSWTAPTTGGAPASYNVYRSTSTGTETLLPTVLITGTTYTDTTAANGTTYFYKVTGVNATGEGALSNEASATPVAPLAVPGAPTALTATGGNNLVTLNWTAPATGGAPASYNVYRSTTTGTETLLPTVLITGTTYTDNSAINGTQYFYKVTAVNATGEGALSNEANATPAAPLALPDAPTALTATPGNAQVVLNWTAPTTGGAPASYNVYRSTTTGTETLLPTVLVTGTTYTDASAVNGITYFYKVTAVNATGEGALSNEASATPAAPLAVPDAPTGLTATGGNNLVTLSWTAPTTGGAPASYNVYRSTSTGTETLLPTPLITGTTYTDSTAANGITYFYKVTAVNATGEGALSNEASATPVVPLAVPGAPTALTATGGNNLVTLNWTAPATGGAPASYNVYRSTSTGTETLLPTVLITGPTYTDATAVNGTTYFYKVTAVNATGEGALSNEANATPAAPLALPDAPTGLTATPGNAQVVLNWTAPTTGGAPASYNVYRSTSTGTEALLPTVLITGTTYTDATAVNGTQYFYEVTAVNATGEGAKSNEASATPQVAIPGTPTGLTAGAGDTMVTLNWTAPATGGAPTSYNIYRSTSTGTEVLLTPSPGTGTTFTDSGLTNGTQYFYKVTAVNAGGESANSNEASATPLAGIASPPASLNATAGNTTVALSWAASATAVSYNVKRSTVLGGPYTTISPAGTVTGTTYNDLGLTNGTTYFYVVTAVNGGGESGNSPEASATPAAPLAAPDPPALSAVAGDTTVTLTVSPGTGTGGAPATYTISRGTAPGGPFTPIAAATNIAGPTYTDTGLTNGTTYFYVATATNASGTSPASAPPVSATPVAALTAPDPPMLSAAPGDTTVTLTVSPGTGTGGAPATYTISRGLAAAGPFTPIAAATNIAGPTFTDTGLTNGTTYYYVATATNAVGTSPASAPPVLATPVAALTAPDPPALSAVAGDTTVTLTVSPGPGPGGAPATYTISRGTAPGGPFTPIAAATNIAGPTYTDTGLTNGTTYYYVATATNAAGTSPASAPPVSATPAVPLVVPDAPTGLSATGGNAQVVLNWTAPTTGGAPASYNVYRSTSTGTETLLPTVLITGTTYTDATAVNGTTYFYKVTAVNAVGEGALSNEASATPRAAGPTGLTAIPGNTTVTLNWTASAGAVTYNVYRGTAAGGEAAVPVATGIAGTNYTDPGLTNGTTYFYYVTAVDAASAESAPSNEASATPQVGAPAAPAGLTATAGNAQIALSWTAVPGAISYNVYRGTTAGGEAAVPVATGVAGPTYTDVGLTNGTQYFYKVTAVNAGGESAPSNEAFATPQAAGPTGLTATPGNAQVVLNWTASAGAVTYNVYRGTTAGGETQLITGVAGTTYTDSAVTNGTTYYYYVTAVDAAAVESAPSNEASATPLAAGPTGLTATAGNATVTLNWTASAGAVTYNVYRGTTAGGETQLITGVVGTTYTDNAVTNGTKYFYYVTAVDAAAVESAPSNEASATPLAAGPTALTATAGNATVTLNWTASAGAVTYNVYRGTSAGTEVLLGSAGAATTYTDNTVVNGTTYFYYVTAVDAASVESAPSNEASATPRAPGPTALTATAGNAQVVLNWTASAGAVTYNVYRGTTAGGEAAVPVATGIAGTTYTDAGLTNGTTYFYYVTAVDAASIESAKSNEASATPLAPGPTALTATAGNATVTLNWTASAGAVTYNVYRSTSAGTEVLLGSAGAATTYTDNTVVNGTTYFYYVTAVDAASVESAPSNEASATPRAPGPTALTATAGNAQVVLNWTASAGAVTYNVYRSTSAGTEVLLGSAGAATTYTDAGLTNGTTYFYYVTAVDATSVETAPSNEVSATPRAPGPTGLTATPGNAQITLNWTALAGAVSYNIYRGLTTGGEAPAPIATGITALTYLDTGLTNGTTYYYVVTAVDGAGIETGPSNEASATPSAIPLPPPAPNIGPYSSPLFHAGGALTPFPFPSPLPSPFLNPLFGQLQGTPTGIINGPTGPVAAQIPSNLLGNFNPALPPAGLVTGDATASTLYPNHFRDGTVFSWSAPLTFLNLVGPTPTTLGTNAHDVQGTPVAADAGSFPDIRNAKYFGIQAGQSVTPDPVPFGGGIVPTAASTDADKQHAIRQLVYFGRSEFIVDTRPGSPTSGQTIQVGALYCVNGFTGEVVWRYQTPQILTDVATQTYRDGSVLSTPAVAYINVLTDPAGPTYTNKMVVIFGDNNGFVYCLDAVGNGDGSSNSDSVDTANNQPSYFTTGTAADGLPDHLGTTKPFWVWRPDPAKPLDGAGATAAVDATANLPAPGAFRLASPIVYTNPQVPTSPATTSNAVVYVGNSNGVLYAIDPHGVPNTAGAVHYAGSLATTVAANNLDPTTPTINPFWWFAPEGVGNTSIESAPALAPPTPPSVTLITSNANPTTNGTASITVTVYDGSGNGGTPTGTVTLSDGTNTQTGTLSGGSATFTLTGLTSGTTTNLTATYGGDANFGGSVSPVLGEVSASGTAATSITVVNSGANPSKSGQTVTFTATVTDGTGVVGPTGTVTFTVGAQTSPAIPLAGGTASFTSGALASGTYPVTASYVGDHTASTSPAFSQVVLGATGPTICFGTSQSLAGGNSGRLYAVDGISGPLGNGGAGGVAPGAAGYNTNQRPLWAFPNAYASGAGSIVGSIRPALGNISGSPVIFSNPDDPLAGGRPRTRIYFAADSGPEVPFDATTLLDPDPASTDTGRIWAVNMDGTTAKNANTITPSTPNVWSYPLANDPNDATLDRTHEPSPPIGSFQHMTPAMGMVQFPQTIQYSVGATITDYTHADGVHADIKSQFVPMLYVGTSSDADQALYQIDVDGYDDATREIYRLPSPNGQFQSSPVLVVNDSTAGGNGGVLYATISGLLYQIDATPISNANVTLPYPFVGAAQYANGGAISGPAVAAADVSDLTPSDVLAALGGKNVTDWVYFGDSAGGFCRGITPQDANDLAAIPPGGYGGVIDNQPSPVPDQRYPLRSFIFDGTTAHPASSTDMREPPANTTNGPNPLLGTIATFEWGQYVYVRIGNVVPPGFDPASPDPHLLVQDPNDPTLYYGNGTPVSFSLGTGPSVVIPATMLAALTPTVNSNGFIQRSDTGRTDEYSADSLKETADTATVKTGKGWIAAYSYPVGSDQNRVRDTPGAYRQITTMSQTASIYKKTQDALGNDVYTLQPGSHLNLAQGSPLGQQINTGTEIRQTPPTIEPTFGILNPVAVRGAGIPLPISGVSQTATALGDPGGVGPFKGVNPANLTTANSPDLEALTNGNSVYIKQAPTSGYDLTKNPTNASANNVTIQTNYPKAYRFVASSLGEIHDGSTGDNSDPTAATGYGQYLLNMADRSAIGLHLGDMDPANPARNLFSPLNVAMQRVGAHWNDNTGENGPGACVNRLPWEDPPITVGTNTSRDYPDIPALAITHKLETNNGESEITGRHADVAPDTAISNGSDETQRTIIADGVKVAMAVPKYQPANLQVWDNNNYVAQTYPTVTTASPAAIPPAGITAGHATFAEGYVEGSSQSQKVFVDLNHNGICDANEPQRDVQVFSGVPVNMATSIADNTLDIGKVPSGFGIQTTQFGPLGPFMPYNANYWQYYLPVTAHNDGNVNLLNVHVDQKVQTSLGLQTLLMQSDPVDPLNTIPAYDLFSATGPRGVFGSIPELPYLIRSSLDTDMVAVGGRNPGILSQNDPVTGQANAAMYAGPSFHKARPGSASPSTLTVPDAPDAVDPNYGMLPSPNGKPTLNYKALPHVSLAIPFGTPVGSYSQTIRIFEGMDTGGYSTYTGNNQAYNPLYPPQYSGAVGGQGRPALAAGASLTDVYLLGAQPVSDPGVILKGTVLEDRMTDGFTYGALPQIDTGQAIPATGVTPAKSTPDFAPAAFRDPSGGNITVYWTTGRGGGFGIQAAQVPFVAPTASAPDGYFAPGDPTAHWFSPFAPTLVGGTNSGLTITQDQAVYNGSSFNQDKANAYGFAVNVDPATLANTLFCYPVTPSSGALGSAQPITNDPAQVKYGVRGLYAAQAGFARSLWAFWTVSTRGRTAIGYNSQGSNGWLPAPSNGPATLGLLPVPAGLTSLADPNPVLITAPLVGNGGSLGAATPLIEVTYTGTSPGGNTDLYISRYQPDATKNYVLNLMSFPSVTERMDPADGWFQSRDVAWSRSGALNLTLKAGATLTPLLYDNSGNPLFGKAVFDKASGLLVLTGVSFTGVAGTNTVTVYVDGATGRVRFTTPPPAGATVLATFNPLARRLTTDSRADTAPITFLDPALKNNEGNSAGGTTFNRVPADRRWYLWRKSGVSGIPSSATLYLKTQRLTFFLPSPIGLSSGVPIVTVTLGGTDVTKNVDVDWARGRIYFPMTIGGTPTEGQQVTVTYTPPNGSSITVGPNAQNTVQWQDEQRANDVSVPPTDAASGLATVIDEAVPLDKSINENNVSAFLDTSVFSDPNGGATTAHKIWLFWNSTRNGTADLYYQTIDPRFAATTGP